MSVRSGQDWATGLLFVTVGAAALWIGADYPLGTAQRPGTGVLPHILAWCLIATGFILWVKALLVYGPRLDVARWAWRPLVMIILAVVSFALLVDRLGLVVSMLVTMTLAALGTPETRWREFAVFSLVMVAIGVLIFIRALGMPIEALPQRALMQVLSWR